MSSKYELKHKISSVTNIKKVTYAMQIIAANRMRGLRPKVQVAQMYVAELEQLVNRLYEPQLDHPWFEEGKGPQDGLLVIANDESMCGAMATDTVLTVKEWLQEYPNSRIGVLGLSAAEHLRTMLGINMDFTLSARTSLKPLLVQIRQWWQEHQFASLHLISQQALQAFKHKTLLSTLVPIAVPSHIDQAYCLLELDKFTLLNEALEQYITATLRLRLLETYACEQATRMIAMKTATDNAEELINKNHLLYNKLRQKQITEELIEMMAGAQAV